MGRHHPRRRGVKIWRRALRQWGGDQSSAGRALVHRLIDRGSIRQPPSPPEGLELLAGGFAQRRHRLLDDNWTDPGAVVAEIASALFYRDDVRCDPSGVGEND